MPQFTHTDFATAKAAVAARLQDSTMKFWIDAELGSYVREALQFWNLAALYNRDKVSLTTVVGQKFYDLSTAVNGVGDAMLARDTKDRAVVNALQYNLRENVNDFAVSSVWAGTSMFTMADLQGAIQRRLNQLLSETSVIVTESQQVVAAGNGRVDLSQLILDIVRPAWIVLDNAGNESAISRLNIIDESTAGKQSRNWAISPATPQSFSIIVTSNLQLQLVPPPVDNGKLHLLTVNDNADLDVTTGIAINLSNDLVPILRYGALADLLSRDGESQDQGRAEYCEKRWQEGVEMAKLYASAMAGMINGVPCQLCSIEDFDGQSFRWQSTVGRPTVLAMAGLNLLATNKVPDAQYGITLDVVRNAILPTADGDFVQIGKEYLDALYDYTVHLALFKKGTAEVQSSTPLYERFMRIAADYNSKLKAHAPAFDVLVTKEREQYKDSPLRLVA